MNFRGMSQACPINPNFMKTLKNILIVVMLGAVCLLSSCKKETVYPTFAAPGWTVTDNPNYSVTMTVIAEIPDHLEQVAQSRDELAAFTGEECRGVANKVGNLYYIMINGTEEEVSQIHFRFYSAATQYLYRTNTAIPFRANEMLGTIENPEKLLLEIIKE